MARPTRRQEPADEGNEARDRSDVPAGVEHVPHVRAKAKEVLGEVTGDDSKEREGPRSAGEDLVAARGGGAEAKADAARSEASLREAEQRMHTVTEN